MPQIVIAAAIGAAIVTGVEVAINALAGGSSEHGPRVLNRSFSTSTYGAEIQRCRGTVRVPGNLIWSTVIQESIYKKVTGKGGSSSFYSYVYSASMAIGFGRGPCDQLLSLWTDGKRMFTAKVANANVSGAVTLLASGGSPALQGSDTLHVSVGSGGFLYLQAGAIIQWPGDPFDYEVLQDVNIGPNQTGVIYIWPPLQDSKTTNAALLVPGANGSTLDQSDFQVDPNLGHLDVAGYRFPRIEAPTFYKGTSSQLPDPVLEEYLGAGNVPGYRDLVYMVLDQLELSNFGNRIPNFTAEIAFDTTNPMFPVSGPVLNPDLTTATASQFIIPGPSEISTQGPLAQGPYVVGLNINQSTSTNSVIVINPQDNTVISTWNFNDGFYPGHVMVGMDGYTYAISSVGLNQWAVEKYETISGAYRGYVGVPISSGGPSFGGLLSDFDGNPIDEVMFEWLDLSTVTPSNPLGTLRHFLAYVGQFGGTVLIDRDTMSSNVTFTCPLDGITYHFNSSIVGWHAWYTGIFNSGDGRLTADHDGNLWLAIGFSGQLFKYGTPPPLYSIPGILLNQDGVEHAECPPLLAGTIYTPRLSTSTWYDISAMLADIGNLNKLRYSYADNSIIIVASGGVGKVNADTGEIIGWEVGAGSSANSLGEPDAVGDIIVGGYRISTVAISGPAVAPVYSTYTYGSFGVGTPTLGGNASWDQQANSLWVSNGGVVYRIFLDRKTGGGVDVGDLIAWLCAQTTLGSLQYNTEPISGTVGSVLGAQFGQQSVRDSILMIMQIFQITATESDGNIVFKPRDSAPAFLITSDDIGALETLDKTEPRIEEILQNQTDIPERISILYFDVARNYQQSLQYAKRISRPYATSLFGLRDVTNSRHELTLTTPLTSDAITMSRQAQKMLFEAWAARFAYTLKTTIKYVFLDPGDVIVVDYQSVRLEMLLTAVDRGAMLPLQIAALSHDRQVYQSTAVGEPGGVVPSS